MEDSTAFLRMLGGAGPGARLLTPAGVVAAVVPVCPERSVVNSVIFEDAARLEAAYPQLERAYGDAGVEAWTVWVPPADGAAIELWVNGHVLAPSQIFAMALTVERPVEDRGVVWSRDG